MKRLYIVVRNDIRAGLQIAQACHAAREFTLRSGEDVGENLVVLHASHAELERLVSLHPCVPFREPDLGGELTAAAFAGNARKLLSCLPLAMRPDRAA